MQEPEYKGTLGHILPVPPAHVIPTSGASHTAQGADLIPSLQPCPPSLCAHLCQALCPVEQAMKGAQQ